MAKPKRTVNYFSNDDKDSNMRKRRSALIHGNKRALIHGHKSALVTGGKKYKKAKLVENNF
jgi:hypothetical protein